MELKDRLDSLAEKELSWLERQLHRNELRRLFLMISELEELQALATCSNDNQFVDSGKT